MASEACSMPKLIAGSIELSSKLQLETFSVNATFYVVRVEARKIAVFRNVMQHSSIYRFHRFRAICCFHIIFPGWKQQVPPKHW